MDPSYHLRMIGTIGPDVARAAVALRRNHPSVPALAVLDTCMRQRTGKLEDFGAAIEPGSPFGTLLAEVFEQDPISHDWALCLHDTTPAAVVASLQAIWAEQVLTKFAERYVLRP